MSEEKHQDTHHSNRNLVVLLSLSIFVVISLLTFLLIKSSDTTKQITKTKAYEEAQTLTNSANPTIRARNIPEGETVTSQQRYQKIQIVRPLSVDNQAPPIVSMDGSTFQWETCRVPSVLDGGRTRFEYRLIFQSPSGEEIVRSNIGEAEEFNPTGMRYFDDFHFDAFYNVVFKPGIWKWWIECDYLFNSKSTGTVEHMLLGKSDIQTLRIASLILKTPQTDSSYDLKKENVGISFSTSDNNFVWLKMGILIYPSYLGPDDNVSSLAHVVLVIPKTNSDGTPNTDLEYVGRGQDGYYNYYYNLSSKKIKSFIKEFEEGFYRQEGIKPSDSYKLYLPLILDYQPGSLYINPVSFTVIK